MSYPYYWSAYEPLPVYSQADLDAWRVQREVDWERSRAEAEARRLDVEA